jgi:hypothetical protein
MLKLDEDLGIEYWQVSVSFLKQNTKVRESWSDRHLGKEESDVEWRCSSLAKHDAAIGASDRR